MALLTTDLSLAQGSYYADTAPRPAPCPPLCGTQRTDVAIVGGGLAGLSAAIELADRGLQVTLLEARALGWGASGRNGGQVIHGLACDIDTVEAQLGATAARSVWEGTLEALDMVPQRCRRFGIDAEWQPGFLNVAVNARKAAALQRGVESLAQRFAYPMQWIGPGHIRQWVDSAAYHSAAFDPRSGHLHPLKYTLGLARAAAALGVALHEHTPVRLLRRGPLNRLVTDAGEVQATQVLLAGNVYLQGLAPALSARIMPVGTYIVCTEPMDEARLTALIPSRSAVCDTNFVLDYFRPTADQRMLFGGRVSYSTRTPARLAQGLQARMVGRFPALATCRVSHAWGGFVDITMNRAPDFGRLPGAAGEPATVYYLQGFSGHGLALTGLAGRLVAQAMAGDAGRFDVFARLRHRAFPGGPWLRTPALVAGMAWYRLRDLLG